jgi:hypothetical protein
MKYRGESLILILVGVVVALFIHRFAGILILIFGIGGVTGIIDLGKYTSYGKFSTSFNGEKTQGRDGSPRKDGLVALSTSFFIPGWGQVYNGDGWLKGWLYGIGIIIGYYIFVFPALIVWLYGVYNAYSTAKKMNSGIVPYRETTAVKFWLYPIIAVLIFVILASIAAASIYGMAGSV